MIQLETVSKTYGGQRLFADLSWRLAANERVGLVVCVGALLSAFLVPAGSARELARPDALAAGPPEAGR